MSKGISRSETLECRKCTNISSMRFIGRVADTMVTDPGNSTPVEHGTLYEVLACPKCKEITIRSGWWHDMMESEDWHGEIIYPRERQGIDGLPPAVEQEYQAAEQVSHISANAYAVLLGRVLDVVCDDRKANGKTLHERLSDLANRHEIPKILADIAHQLRQLRNVGAHADLGTLTEDEVPVLAALCRAVLEYVYLAPRLVDQVEKLVQKIKGT